MAVFTIPVAASQTYTATGVFTNAQTITVAGKAYTTQTSLTDVDGNVKIGADTEATIDNLVAAINLSAGAGTNYAASMTKNPHCRAVKGSATTLVVYALCPGLIGNFLTVAETQTNGAWGAGNLAGGTGSLDVFIDLLQQSQVSAEVAQALEEIS